MLDNFDAVTTPLFGLLGCQEKVSMPMGRLLERGGSTRVWDDGSSLVNESLA